MRRGDVVVVDWPFSGGAGSKPRPAVVVQNDRDNQRMTNTIVAMVTSRVFRSGEPTQLFVDVTTPDGQKTGLHRSSVVNCANLFTIEQTKIIQTIGFLTPPLIQGI